MKNPSDEMVLIKTLGLVWYVKWFATIMVLIAVICRSVPEVDRFWDLLFSLIGTFGWLYVGLAWKDRALIMLNAVIVVMLTSGLLRNIL
jgi:hypothetical protein